MVIAREEDFEYTKENFRFKTKEEMLIEFGDNWRYCHLTAFVAEMDYLLGKSLSDVCLIQYRLDGFKDLFAKVDGFFVETYMITKNETNKNMKGKEEKNMECCKCTRAKAKSDLYRFQKLTEAMHTIKGVNFDDNKKTVTVVLKDGTVGVSKCSSTDEYDQRVGFCIAFTNATFCSRNQVTKLVKHYNGEEKKKNEEKKLREEIIREIKLEEYKKKVEESNKKREQRKAELKKEIEKELKNKK